MAQYIDKSTLVAEIERLLRKDKYSTEYVNGKKYALKKILSFLDTLEVKEVIAEQECVCNQMLQRLIGKSWNLNCVTDKIGLKQGDKVNVIICKS